MSGMAGEESTTMESFLSRVTTLKCLQTFLSCASTILGERVKDVNKIRLPVFLFAAGSGGGWGGAPKGNERARREHEVDCSSEKFPYPFEQIGLPVCFSKLFIESQN